jgi:hypothetical protein
MVTSVINWFLIPTARIDNEFPLGSFQGIVVDSNQNIYISIDCCERIPFYDKRGNFHKIPTFLASDSPPYTFKNGSILKFDTCSNA